MFLQRSQLFCFLPCRVSPQRLTSAARALSAVHQTRSHNATHWEILTITMKLLKTQYFRFDRDVSSTEGAAMSCYYIVITIDCSYYIICLGLYPDNNTNAEPRHSAKICHILIFFKIDLKRKSDSSPSVFKRHIPHVRPFVFWVKGHRYHLSVWEHPSLPPSSSLTSFFLLTPACYQCGGLYSLLQPPPAPA